MSEKRIVVPEGMLTADHTAWRDNHGQMGHREEMRARYAAALRWLSENPIVPTPEQYSAMMRDWKAGQGVASFYSAVEWQRRMFFALDTEPSSLDDLLYSDCMVSASQHNDEIHEAYRRGQKAGK